MPEYGEHFYQVRWKGFAESTWEPAVNLSHCSQLVKLFNAEVLNSLKAQKEATVVESQSKLKRLKKQSSTEAFFATDEVQESTPPKQKRARKSKGGVQQGSNKRKAEKPDVVVIDEEDSSPQEEGLQSKSESLYPPALKNYIPG